MANDLWNGAGAWTGNPTDWSLGSPPASGETAEVQTGSLVLSSNGGTDILDPAGHATGHASAARLVQAMATFDASAATPLAPAPLGGHGWEFARLLAVRA